MIVTVILRKEKRSLKKDTINNMSHPYYKKIDRSALEGWLIIPKEYESDFLHGSEIKPSTSRDIKIKYKINLLKQSCIM